MASEAKTRDHGGNLDWAMAQYGGAAETWIDLSTGINRVPYPMPELAARAWQALPTKSDMARLRTAAQTAYGTQAPVVPLAGAQAAIQTVPHLEAWSDARVLTPTYNEHAASLRAMGCPVREVADLADLEGADLAVVVTPNNPDGRVIAPVDLLDLAQTCGLLVVDESFADATPETSVAPFVTAQTGNLMVLRSFGKFYGLAGVRLGFAIAGDDRAGRMAEMAGPWPISGPAIAAGCAALGDTPWQEETAARLAAECAEMDALAAAAGWRLVGGTALFRTYETPDAQRAQDALARAQIWSRIFPYSGTWLRLGLPGGEAEWSRVREVFIGLSAG